MTPNHKVVGKVYFVGAGPGDPELITLKGYRLVRRADVILYDRLIPHVLLDEAPEYAECVYVGKDPITRQRCEQSDINAMLVAYALEGKQVVRLKGGDPLIFGRGGEEALACFQAGIPFEIVPGVSSIQAVPAYAGIPLTHRHMSSSFTVITGHEDPEKSASSINYDDLVKQNGTIVILMGLLKVEPIVTRLIDCGLSSTTPAACIEQGTTEAQRVLIGSLQDLPKMVETAELTPPTLIIIGQVVTLRQKGVQWFEQISHHSV